MRKLVITTTTVLALITVLAVGCAGAESPLTSPTPSPASAPSPTPASTTQTSGTGFGAIEVRVTDALPDIEIQEVWIHFSEVSVHKAADEPEGDGVWIDIPIENGSFELVGLGKEGLEALLAEDDYVPSGKYTQIRVIIDEGEGKGVQVTYEDENEVVHVNVPATLPSGVLKFIHPFNVVDSTTTIITLDFIVEQSVVFTGATSEVYNEDTQQYEPKIVVKPVVKLSIEQESLVGTIDGTVTDSGTTNTISGATVFVEDTELSDETDENGDYEITGVPVGAGTATYTVTAAADGYESASEENVEVSTGTTSTVDFALDPASP